MGRKINPISHRINLKKKWRSNWFCRKGFDKQLGIDLKIRAYLQENLRQAGIGKVEISRGKGLVDVSVHTSRPGIVIGHKGEGVTKIQKDLAKEVKTKIKLNVKEIRKPELWAQVMAEQLAYQLEKRAHFRRAMKQIMEEITRNSQVKGAKIKISGRLGGTEIARSEHLSEGALPLQTLRSDIDYGFALARTKFGSIGVKVWINRGEQGE